MALIAATRASGQWAFYQAMAIRRYESEGDHAGRQAHCLHVGEVLLG
jgi:hypothetical protein